MKVRYTLLVCTLFLTLACSAQVKISQMTNWTGSMDSAYVPIVVNLVNYKTLGTNFSKARIDSIVNNWPAGGGSGIMSIEGQNGTVVVNDSIVKLGTNPLIENTVIDGDNFYLRFTDTRVQEDLGASIAAANNLTLGADGNTFSITGATQINAITTANWQAGSVVRLIFASTPTVKHNTAGGAGTAVLQLAGATDFVATANDVMSLVYDGTDWHETSRKLSGISPSAVRFGYPGEDQTTNANRSFTWGANSLAMTFNSLTDNGLSITSTATGLNTASKTLNVTVTGALSGSSITNYAIYGSNLRTGTSITAVGVYGEGTTVGVRGSSASTAVSGVASGSGSGVIGQSSSGLGVWGTVGSGTGVSANATSGKAFSGSVTANTATAATGIHSQFQMSSSGTAANGFGGYFSFETETSTAVIGETARMEWWWTDATNGTRTGSWGVGTVNNGASASTRKLEVTGGGNVIVLTAGKGLALTSPDGTLWYITVSNAGVLSTSTTAP